MLQCQDAPHFRYSIRQVAVPKAAIVPRPRVAKYIYVKSNECNTLSHRKLSYNVSKKGEGLANNPSATPAINSVALSLRLLKVATAKEALKAEHGLRSMNSAVGELWVGQSPATPPGWVDFLGQLAPEARVELRTQSCAAVLFVETAKPAKRLFALCFGQGHHSIDESAIERGFGLKVTLNQVSRDRLRTIDSATLDSTVI